MVIWGVVGDYKQVTICYLKALSVSRIRVSLSENEHSEI